MIQHYDAFISYKHAEKDSDIAATVQRQLEHFHFPASISRKIGKKKINRIFRDKEELPITSSLTETITNALNNSDYLIVICSEKTKESIWVDKEIRTFLESHDRSHVLTVLAEGEPFNVIPQILLSQEREIVDEEGNTQIITESLEPLSCDYRMGKKAANKVEIPRLAAAILGCSYDELVDRQRQYAMRRSMTIMAAVLALSFVFGGYMFYSRTRVNKAYQQALENQSRYLASESRSNLQDGRRINALLLALEALPDEEHSERPVTPEAVRALTDSSLSYVTSNALDFMEQWNYKMPNNIKQIAFSKGEINRAYVAALDAAGIVKCWDVLTHEELISAGNDGNEIIAIVAVNDELFLTITYNRVIAYDIPSREIKWTYENEFGDLDGGYYQIDDNYAYFTGILGIIYKINLSDGSLYPYVIVVKDLKSLSSDFLGMYNYSFSPSMKAVAFTMKEINRSDGSIHETLYTYDFPTDELRLVESYDEETKVGAVKWAKDDSVFVALEEKRKTIGMITGSYKAFFQRSVVMKAVNPTDSSIKWTYSFKANMEEKGTGLAYDPIFDYIAYYTGNVVAVVYAETGIEKGVFDVNDIIVTSVEYEGLSPSYITYKGEYVQPNAVEKEDTDEYEPGKGMYVSAKMAPENTVIAEIMNGMYFVREDDNEICSYGNNMRDPEFTTVLEAVSAGTRDENYYADDNYLLDENYLFIYSDGEGYIYRISDHKNLGKVDLTGNGRRSNLFRIVGRSGEKIYLADYDQDNRIVLTCVDLQTLEVTDTVLEEKSDNVGNMFALRDDQFLYITEINAKYALHSKNLTNGEEKEFEVAGELSGVDAIFAIEDSDKVLISGNSECVIDIATGEQMTLEVGSGWIGTKYYAHSREQELLLLTDGQFIDVFDSQCNMQGRLQTSGSKILFMSFYDDNILAGCEDGYLYMYSTHDGALVKRTEITLEYYKDSVHNLSFERDEKNNLLFLHVGMHTNIFDMESFYEITSINWSLGYHKPSDTIWSFSVDSNSDNGDETFNSSSVGYFRHYTLDELISKAKDIVAGAELSDELKEKYGIH